jgi:hypothetical protein
MLQTWAKEDGNHFPGDILDIDDAIAADHIKNRYAEEFVPEAPPGDTGSTPASLSALAAQIAAQAVEVSPVVASAPVAPAAS